MIQLQIDRGRGLRGLSCFGYPAGWISFGHKISLQSELRDFTGVYYLSSPVQSGVRKEKI
jgi:hypothetical protein